MRWNESEVSELAVKVPDWEGKLDYKPPGSRGGLKRSSDYKERWFKLKGNCLFYLRIGPLGRPDEKSEPVGVLILENFIVRRNQSYPEAFSLSFGDEPEKLHQFVADNPRHVHQWISALKSASYESCRERLIELQIKIRNKSGRDPLLGTGFDRNPIYCHSQATPIEPPVFANGISPKPLRPSRRSKKSNFESYVVEQWEKSSPYEKQEDEGAICERKATFKSHITCKEGTLIDFS